jgi:hypothetical protein
MIKPFIRTAIHMIPHRRHPVRRSKKDEKKTNAEEKGKKKRRKKRRQRCFFTKSLVSFQTSRQTERQTGSETHFHQWWVSGNSARWRSFLVNPDCEVTSGSWRTPVDMTHGRSCQQDHYCPIDKSQLCNIGNCREKKERESARERSCKSVVFKRHTSFQREKKTRNDCFKVLEGGGQNVSPKNDEDQGEERIPIP